MLGVTSKLESLDLVSLLHAGIFQLLDLRFSIVFTVWRPGLLFLHLHEHTLFLHDLTLQVIELGLVLIHLLTYAIELALGGCQVVIPWYCVSTMVLRLRAITIK